MKYDGDLYKYLKDELNIDETNIDYKKPPKGVTYEMLKGSMGNSRDFQLKIKEIEKDKRNMVAEVLWSPYAKTMFPPNNFGLYVEKQGLKHMDFALKITPHKEKKTTSLLRETLFSKPITPLKINSTKGKTRFTKRTKITKRIAGGKNKKSKKKYSKKTKGWG